ncbi:MAG: hypothetical protein KGJ13_05675 [Patescibacteria group bacterium]|nr:hypothetical protein [Patescibacteria group bacterium]
MAARKRSSTRRKSAVHHHANPLRRTRKASAPRVYRSHATHHARRRNPLFTRKRRSVRHRNPIGGALGQAIPLVGASFAITFVAPIATRLVGGFLPLGQFTQPAVLTGTGYGLGWIAGKLGFGKYKGPLEIMGVTLGLTALVAPYLRGLMAPSAPAPPQGAAPARTGVNGIGAYRPGMQPFRAYQQKGLSGIGTYQPGQQPFGQYALVA